jgi:hypothetical protein
MRKAGFTGVALVCAVLVSAAQAATIRPTVKSDDSATNGNCTMREAVDAATTNQPVDACPKGQKKQADKILLRSGSYALAGADSEDDNQTGDLDVEGGGPVQLVGRGIGKTTLASPNGDRVLDLFEAPAESSTNVRLGALALDGGSPDLWGGVIRADEGTGGRLTLDRVNVQDGALQFGGGIWINSGKLAVKRSVFAGNSARVNSMGFPGVHAIGGAIQLGGTSSAKIADTTFSDNSAITNDSSALGGAIALQSGADAVIRRSLFEGNDAYSSSANAGSTRLGGAIWMNSGGGLRVVNSTFYLNRALGSGAGARGGAFYGAAAGSTEFVHSTFLENDAISGTTFLVNDGSLELSRSVVQPDGVTAACGVLAGDFHSNGYNVAPNTFGCDLEGPGDKLADPLLDDSLEDNGGPTDTIKLKKNSPAVNLIPAKKCRPAQGEDQRRYRRPAGRRCDSGAYERGAKRR